MRYLRADRTESIGWAALHLRALNDEPLRLTGVVVLHDPAAPTGKALTSYCTLFGRLRSDKGRRRGSVAPPLSFDQDDIAEGRQLIYFGSMPDLRATCIHF